MELRPLGPRLGVVELPGGWSTPYTPRNAEAAIDGERIRQIRERLGLTQQQLAQMLGVHPMTISKWERNQAQPTPYNVQQLMLMEDGTGHMGDAERKQFVAMIATGLFVGALALVVGLGVRDFGNRRGWW